MVHACTYVDLELVGRGGYETAWLYFATYPVDTNAETVLRYLAQPRGLTSNDYVRWILVLPQPAAICASRATVLRDCTEPQPSAPSGRRRGSPHPTSPTTRMSSRPSRVRTRPSVVRRRSRFVSSWSNSAARSAPIGSRAHPAWA